MPAESGVRVQGLNQLTPFGCGSNVAVYATAKRISKK
jgi:hypothetical protein